MDSPRVRKWRQPVAVVLLVLAVLRCAVAVVVAVWAGGGTLGWATSVVAVLPATSELLVVLLTVAAAWSLLAGDTAGPRIAVVAIVVVALGLAVDLAGLVVLAPRLSPALLAAQGLRLLVPALSVVVLATLLAGGGARGASTPSEPEMAAAVSTPPAPAAAPPPTMTQAVWEPDVAAGAVWRSASAAASGAAANDWGRPGETAGWSPDGPEPAMPQSDSDDTPPAGA